MSLTLNISEKERSRLLDDKEGAKPLRPLLNNFGQARGTDKVDEPAITSILEGLGTTRLLKIVRPKTDLTGDASLAIHEKFADELTDELARAMASHKSFPIPYANGDDEARKAAHQKIHGMNTEDMVTGLRMKPKGPFRWMDFITSNQHGWQFDGSSLLTPKQLVLEIQDVQRFITPDTSQTKTLGALMDDLAGAVEKCESIEAWLSTCLFIWWGACKIFPLSLPSYPGFPVFNWRERVAGLLKNYVATVLLVESVSGGDTGKPQKMS